MKVAQVEFFQPLCDLVENKLSVEVGELVVSSQAEVPTLVELCIRKTHKEALGRDRGWGWSYPLVDSLISFVCCYESFKMVDYIVIVLAAPYKFVPGY